MYGICQAVGTWAADDRAAFNTELLWTTLLLVGILLFGAAAIAWARWRARSLPGEMTRAEQEVYYRALLEQDELSREEFERITGVLQQPPGPAPSPAPPERPVPPSAATGPASAECQPRNGSASEGGPG